MLPHPGLGEDNVAEALAGRVVVVPDPHVAGAAAIRGLGAPRVGADGLDCRAVLLDRDDAPATGVDGAREADRVAALQDLDRQFITEYSIVKPASHVLYPT